MVNTNIFDSLFPSVDLAFLKPMRSFPWETVWFKQWKTREIVVPFWHHGAPLVQLLMISRLACNRHLGKPRCRSSVLRSRLVSTLQCAMWAVLKKKSFLCNMTIRISKQKFANLLKLFFFLWTLHSTCRSWTMLGEDSVSVTVVEWQNCAEVNWPATSCKHCST